ncbi:MAG: glycoside hydrolase family 75 protein [Chthoniobacterales bacterium]|nr:glycoside hydrolase family 75 protein [Chthoniobacterales bacterium]
MITFSRKWKISKTIANILLTTSIGLVLGCHKKKHTSELTLPRANYDLVKMANGAVVQAQVETNTSTNCTLVTAATPEDYRLQLTLHVAIPKPATTLSELAAATPEMPQALPNLEEMIPSSAEGKKTASPFFATLFENKTKSLQHHLSHLEQLFPRESLYDCQTILTLTNKKNGVRALLVQAIMNVNADGSDGDRNIPLEKLSVFYQPQTNYRWPKATSHANPNLHDVEEKWAQAKLSLTNTALTLDQKTKLQEQVSNKEQMLTELQRWSFLIGSADPFIVLPKFMLDSKNADSASVGDYAIVLYQNKLYPAIIGDIGPSSKIGEASLRLCRAIDPRSGADRRPVSSPQVSYFIFPKSADLPMSAPNYTHWSDRCHQLWNALGGSSSINWHEWTSLEQPLP